MAARNGTIGLQAGEQVRRDASAFNSDIMMSAPASCGKQGGNVHVRLHASILPRDF